MFTSPVRSIAPNQLLPGQQFFNPAAPPAGFFLFPSAATGVLTDYTKSRSFVNVSPRLGLDYRWTPQVMSYVSYSRGFKSGGFDMRGNAPCIRRLKTVTARKPRTTTRQVSSRHCSMTRCC